jgi:DNA-binding transcriptional MerR regulator
MPIKEVAARASVNEQTIRFYQREGVIPPPLRSANGYREYPAETVGVVRFIKPAQRLGLSLADAHATSGVRDAPAPHRLETRAMAQAKPLEIEEKIADLLERSRTLRQ